MAYFVKVENGVNIYVEDFGYGQPVVFLHPWPLNHNFFERQASVLAQNGFRFIGIDLRGFGKSDKPWTGYDFDTLASDVKKVIDALHLHKLVLIGFSIGAPIAIRFLTLYGGEKVSKLLLISAAAPSYTQRKGCKYGKKRKEVDLLISRIQQDRPRQMALYTKMYFYKRKSKEFRTWFHSLGMESGAHSMIHSMATLRDDDVLGELGSIATPTAIFHGKNDRSCSFRLAQELKKKIPHSILVPFHKSGHGLNWDEPEKCNEEMIRFLKNV
ncbi:alpha/beta fold hydrolase [Planomicrobium sp. CPCC 101079]|uniref:alpha/beta fold hydrolase n=1 Tax=Planomicrobium sp. CPCC 101079 TaxID=2599618 RepID=UPI0011B664FE|nr:alpha/beta hydrolase [Planomicrobium sp. CPCC 101079]TWT14346.1 alpha/beta hydrolase [Planomicrobium sp. CPCC 101079]